MGASSPLTTKSDALTFVLQANDRDLEGQYAILSLVVERAINRIPSATVVVRDGEAAQEDFAAAAGKDFAPGAKIEIQAGYHGNNSTIFTGIVVKSSIQQHRGGPSTFTFVCRDQAVGMTIGRRSACYTNTTDGDVLTTLIGRHGLTAEVASTTEQLEEITQYAATDWDFLLTRTEANGLIVQVSDGKVSVKAPDFSSSPVLKITYGFDVLDADLEEDARHQYSSVACTAWDPATQKITESKQSAKDLNSHGSDRVAALAKIFGSDAFALHTPAPLPSATLKTWAEAQLLKCALAKIRGTLRFQGSALALPGALITIDGFGPRFDGDAYVGGVTHEIRDGNWTTLVSVGLDGSWFGARADVSVPGAAALLPAVPGVHLATVKQIHEDPANGVRVLVEVHTIDNTGNGIWARLASPYATKNAGWYFYPEVGDEVVLSFLAADPRYPVILGGLYSSSRTAPFTPDQKNTHKAIITNSQLKVLFEDEKKILTISTPGGHTLVFSDEDKSIKLTDLSGNALKLETSGITLESVKDINLSAAQNITLEAKAGSLTAKGTQGITASGLTISLSADTELKASGNASASLTSAGQMKIQGAIVMIN